MEVLNAPPYYYNYQNMVEGLVTPSTTHIHNTQLAAYYRRLLLKKAISVFKWSLPKTWDEKYFKYILYTRGFIGVLNTDKFGVICQYGTLSGYNVFYAPSKMIFTNPLYETQECLINENCALIQLQPDYASVMDVVSYYADKLALASEAADMNITNSKLAYVFGADSKATAQSMKKLFDSVQSGNPAVFIDNKLNENGKINFINNNLRSNYIAGDILDDMRSILNEFDTLVGIPNANTEKRERMITDEVNANNAETACLAELWLDTLKIGIDSCNKIFGTDIKVEWRFEPNVNSKSIGNREDIPRTI